LVNKLTTGTRTSPASIAITPALMGDVRKAVIKTRPVKLQNMFADMMPTPVTKLTITAAFVVRFQYKEYRNGPR